MSAPDNLKHPSESAALGAKVAKVVAWVSGLFSLVICIMLLISQVQIMTTDPLNDPVLKALRDRVAQNPEDQKLRETVRDLQFVARRSFFTNQSQMREAGLLLLGACAIFLASMKTLVELRLRNPVPIGPAPREGGSQERSAYRWAVVAGGGLVVVGTLLMVFLSPPEIELVLGKEPPPEAKPAAPGTETKSPPVIAKSNPTAPSTTKTTPDAPVAPSAPPPVPVHSWPSFRGPHGLGVAGHRDAPLKWDGKTKENILWSVPIPKGGTNSPVVWDKRVFVAGADADTREVYAFDAEKGALLWTTPVGPKGGPLPEISKEVTYSASTLATDGERLYAVFGTGDIAAIKMDDGKIAWPGSIGAPKISYGYSSSLLTYPGRVLVQYDGQKGGHLLAFDAKSGSKLWDRAREVRSCWASPILANPGSGWQVVLSGDPIAMGHDPASGSILWQVPWFDKEKSVEVATSPAFANGIAFFATDRAALVAIKPGEPKILWKYDEGDLPDIASLVAKDKFVLMVSSSGVVTCFEGATGKKLWSHEFEESVSSSPIVVDDRVYLLAKNGVTFMFQLGESFKEIARNALADPSEFLCTPAFPAGRIFVRTEKTLYCIGASAR